MGSGWITTFSGNKFYYGDVANSYIDIKDIAHSLSMQCRFVGQCPRFYSVAEHSISVSKYLSQSTVGDLTISERKKLALVGLLHDAAEAYISDIPGPMKKRILIGVKAYEDEVLKVIFDKFLWFDPSEYLVMVKEADELWLHIEYREFFGRVLNLEFVMPEAVEEYKMWFAYMPPVDAKNWFMHYYDNLTRR